MPEDKRKGPLSDIRVIELGQLIAGPFCGQLLGDMGAEVIKVEQPGSGDPMRIWGRGDKPVWWTVIARNKKSVTLNLREAEGQEILKELIKDADILIENFRPGTMEKWGLGYDVLQELNPGLIMVRVSGYGQTGPYAKRAGYGAIGEAMGGMRYLAGDPSNPPSRVGLSIGDSLAATYACIGALSALHSREKTGRGQVVDSAIYESVLAMMEATIPEYTEANFIRERTGSILPKVSPSNVYSCKDGDFLIAANQDTVFKRLCNAMNMPELSSDSRYATHNARGEHQEELDNIINEWTKGFNVDEVEALMEKHGVPAGKIYRAPEMLDDPHFVHREAIVQVESDKYHNIRMQNVFPKMSETQGEIRWLGPELGQHTEEVYGTLLGLDADQIELLRERNII